MVAAVGGLDKVVGPRPTGGSGKAGGRAGRANHQLPFTRHLSASELETAAGRLIDFASSCEITDL